MAGYALSPGENVGPALATLRIAAGVTKGRMAQVLNCHADTVSRYESTPSTITLERAVAYCHYLNIDVALFIRTVKHDNQIT